VGFSIVTNVASLNAQRQLQATSRALTMNIGRLSSGLRINAASDDAAGLAISEKLRSQIRSMAQAERNANDGVSMLQTAEGALNETSAILTRMRELAIQAANGTLGTQERGFLQTELVQLRSEVDRIANVTEFNGITLLNGSAGQTTFQVGINSGPDFTISISIDDMNVSALGFGLGSAVTNLSVTTDTRALAALRILDEAISDVSEGRADMGAVQNRLQITSANLASQRENLSAANSRIRDVDVAEETSALTRNNILMQAGVSVLSQANQVPALALSLLE
jgi:flagellin